MPSYDSQAIFRAFAPNPQPPKFGAGGVQHFHDEPATVGMDDRRPPIRGSSSRLTVFLTDEEPSFASGNAIRFRPLRGEP